MDPGAFICMESDSAGEVPTQNRARKLHEIGCGFAMDSIDDKFSILTDAALSKGADVCDFMRARASNLQLGFLYNQRVRVR